MNRQILDSIGKRSGSRTELKLVWDQTMGVNTHRNVTSAYDWVTPDLNQAEVELFKEEEPDMLWLWDANDQRYGIQFEGRRFFISIDLAVACKIKCDGGPAATPVETLEPLPPDPEFDKEMAELKNPKPTKPKGKAK